MADYFAISDVDGWLPVGNKLDQQTGEPTRKLVEEEWIPGYTNDINVSVKLGGGTVPVTDTDWLGRFNVRAARDCAYQVMVKRNASRDEKIPAEYLKWHEEYMDMLKKLEEKAIANLSTSSTGAIASSYTMNAPDNPDSSVNPVFTRDQAHNW